MVDLKEQRICVKFCFKLGKLHRKRMKLSKTAFGDNANVLSMSEHQEHAGDLFRL
jgi:hypothetical protein